ncbi:MAG: LacI family DNA-binding transcriptional regulator [Bacteroidales bacterium]|nr:LacI family DNA-binding transcriptional regulator [Bacteroidales bacterium]
MPSKRPSLKDIAEISGVSIGTVDMVLHNRGEIV